MFSRFPRLGLLAICACAALGTAPGCAATAGERETSSSSGEGTMGGIEHDETVADRRAVREAAVEQVLGGHVLRV